jgi:ATP-dependent Clp protease ATP-binding subunit ClpC
MRFRLPIFIAQSGTSYAARPLFFANPERSDENLNRLLTKLSGDIVGAIETTARDDRQDDVAKWAFAPTITQQRLQIPINLRRRTVKGRFLFVSFRHLGRKLAFSPSLPDLWFEVARGERLETRAEAVFTEHWRKVERDAEGPDQVNPVADALKGKAWVQVIDLSAQVPAVLKQPPKFSFLALGGGEQADGASELRRVGRCLDWLYPDELDRAVLRDAEVAELQRLLESRERRPVLLVGPRQVGKSAVLHEAVFRRVSERKRVHVQSGNVWLISPQRLISGMSYVGQWEGRLLAILRHARKREHVLYFDDLIGLFFAGVTSQSALNAATVLKPYLEDRQVRVLGEITPEALRVLRERDRGFADQFDVLPIREPTDAENLRALVAIQRRLEGKHACNFGLDVLPAAIDSTRRFERSAAFPGKAAALLTRLAVKIAAASEPSADEAAVVPSKRPSLSRDDVLADVAARSGLSLTFLDPNQRLDRDEVRDQLAAQVIGQTEAAEALADVVSIAKARLNDPGRPLAAFLFLGPTGVGKTESAKAVARVLFGDAGRLVRFDLNEFNQPGAAAKLVGAFERPEGLLTAAIRRQPFAVLLLDEVEKAAPEVFDVLLQVLGEGRLTDALGRTADFTNAIIILTSNLGVREAEGRVGFDARDDSGAFVRTAERFFRPEFFNRLDRVVPFRRLTRANLAVIARRLVDGVLGRAGFAQRNCVLDVAPEALERVIDAGYDPALGGRAMKRAVERELTGPAAAKLAALAPDEFTIVSVRSGPAGLTVDVRAPGWAAKRPVAQPPPVEQRLASARGALALLTEMIASHRAANPIVSGQITPDHLRYFTLKELAGEIEDSLERLEETSESRHHHYLQARQPEAVGRKVRYRAIKVGPLRFDHETAQPFRSILSALQMEEAIRELLQEVEPADPAQDLFDLENRLALLALMATAPLHERRTYLWIRGFPLGTANQSAAKVSNIYKMSWAEGFGVELRGARPPGLPASDELIEVKGFHARLLAQSDMGTHLVLPKQGGPVPVRVDVIEGWPAALAEPFTFGPIVRIYPEGQPILDVRTGLIAPQPYAPELIRAMTLAALPRT